MQGQIYTYIGDILLAVNPFTQLGIYNEEWSRKYQNSLKNENPPHIFAVADFTYQAMMHNHTNQCIIISGESGSGKTESANFLLQQLTILGRVSLDKASFGLFEKRLLMNPAPFLTLSGPHQMFGGEDLASEPAHGGVWQRQDGHQ